MIHLTAANTRTLLNAVQSVIPETVQVFETQGDCMDADFNSLHVLEITDTGIHDMTYRMVRDGKIEFELTFYV